MEDDLKKNGRRPKKHTGHQTPNTKQVAHAPFGEQVAHAPFGEQVAHAPFGDRLT